MSGGCRLGGIVLDHLITFRKAKGHPVHANFVAAETKRLGPRKDLEPAQSLPVETREGEARASLREVECTANGQGLNRKNSSAWA